jgi:hypothetical protein
LEEEHYERPLGNGTVRKVQSNGLYVVTLDTCYDKSAEDSLNKLLTPNTALVAKVCIGSAMSLQHTGAASGATPPLSGDGGPSIGPAAPDKKEKA